MSEPRLFIARDLGDDLLRAMIEAEGAAGIAPATATLDELRRMVAAWQATVDQPVDLHGKPCALPAPAWHLQALLALADGDDGAAARARRQYHARWLGHLLMPDRPEFRPLVTILIPTYNRAAMTAEAVESCLAQTWRPIEVLVVDDGSTDDLAGALARFGTDVRVVRKENGGVSTARNTGITAARGDFIHFLDSDNLLLPLSAARKVDAFAHIADAELCYSRAEVRGSRRFRQPAADGSAPESPIKTVDVAYPISLMLGSDSRHGFYVSCVMVPRFTLLMAGPFDKDMRRTEDTLYWLRLALRGTKAIRVEAKLTVRRLFPDRLSAPTKPVWLKLLFTLRTARYCLASPRNWPVVAHCMATVRRILVKQAEHAPITPATRAEIVALAAEMGAFEDKDGMPALPLFAQCRHLLAVPKAGVDSESQVMLRTLRVAAHKAAQRSAPLTPADLLYWRDTAVTVSANGRLNAFCRHAAREVVRSPAALPLVDELLRHSIGIPKRRTIDRYLTLRKLGVPRWLALRLCG